MITFVRTCAFTPDKNTAVMTLTRQIKRHLQSKYGLEVHAQLPVGGSPNRIAYIMHFCRLSELEELLLKLAEDSDYRRLVSANARNLLPGSIYDEIWREIETASDATGG